MCPLKNNTGFQYHLLSIPRVTSQGASNKVVNNYNIFNYNGGSSCYGNWLFGANYGCGCGCGFGGFNWSSFGNCFKAGLGFGLANLATGLIGCGFNWLMGGITTGNWRLGDYFGMGGYGMDGHGAGGYGYNNYGNSWIYGADNSRSKGNEKVKTETKEDQDSQRLVNLDKEVSTMEATFKKNPEAVIIERFTDLYNAVSKKADTDDICKNANNDLQTLLHLALIRRKPHPDRGICSKIPQLSVSDSDAKRPHPKHTYRCLQPDETLLARQCRGIRLVYQDEHGQKDCLRRNAANTTARPQHTQLEVSTRPS